MIVIIIVIVIYSEMSKHTFRSIWVKLVSPRNTEWWAISIYFNNLMLSQQQTAGECIQLCPVVSWCLLLFSSGSVLSALRRRTAGEFLAEDPNLCLSLRENEDQLQLLCNDRRSKFNFNPFGLRFGKRYNGYIYRRAVKRARTNKFSPLSLFSRELEVPTWNRCVSSSEDFCPIGEKSSCVFPYVLKKKGLLFEIKWCFCE